MQASYVHPVRPPFRHVNRTFSHASRVRMGGSSTKDLKKYSDTLLLPQTSLPMRHDAGAVERAFANKTGPQLYRWQVRNSDSGHILNTYWEPLSRNIWMGLCSSSMTVRRTQMDGFIWVIVPSASIRMKHAHRHQGHALNKIIKDVINRFNVLLGRRVQ